MRVKQGPTIHQGQFVAMLEQHRMWRYVIKRVDNDELLFDGWTSELQEAVDSADRQLDVLCDVPASLPKAG